MKKTSNLYEKNKINGNSLCGILKKKIRILVLANFVTVLVAALPYEAAYALRPVCPSVRPSAMP